jgi:hypothetical protein
MRAILLRWVFLPVLSVSTLGQSSTVVVPITPASGAEAAGTKTASTATDDSAEPIVIERLDSVYEMASEQN